MQQALDLPAPRYLHAPLVLGPHGEKLSKQNGAAEVATLTQDAALSSLGEAARTLGLSAPLTLDGDASGDNTKLTPIAHALARWTDQWRALYTDP